MASIFVVAVFSCADCRFTANCCICGCFLVLSCGLSILFFGNYLLPSQAFCGLSLFVFSYFGEGYDCFFQVISYLFLSFFCGLSLLIFSYFAMGYDCFFQVISYLFLRIFVGYHYLFLVLSCGSSLLVFSYFAVG